MSAEAIVIIIVISIYFLYYLLLKYVSTNLRNDKKSKYADFIRECSHVIHEAVDSFKNLQKGDRFLSYMQMQQWLNKYEDLASSIKFPASELEGMEVPLQALKDFQHYYKNAELVRTNYNHKFVEKEIKESPPILDAVEKYPLTPKQKEAIVHDEDNCLVVAGAGTGKTSTITGKAVYLLKRLQIPPEEILMLSFTDKSAAEMAERIQRAAKCPLDVFTFHKLGLNIISQAEGIRPDIVLTNQEELFKFIGGIFKKLLYTESYETKLINYYLNRVTVDKLASEKLVEFYKEESTYLDDVHRAKILNGEEDSLEIKRSYKSFEEVKIANFLYLNCIDFIYEHSYEHLTANQVHGQYHPDFYLPDYKIYIEHFGLIDRDNNVPEFFRGVKGKSAKEVYNEGIKWKRETHKNFGTSLVETYSYENKEGTLLENLKKKLMEKGVNFEVSRDAIRDKYEKEYPSFHLIKLFCTFLTLMKSNGFTTDTLRRKTEHSDNPGHYRKFIEIFEPIFDEYQSYLHKHGHIDFSDMIIKAAEYVRNKRFISPYKYILVDEFQDISVGRYSLIKALLEQNPEAKSFCVGDDWQSIYKFTGSDIALFTKFENYFGYTKKIFLDETFRFNDQISKVSEKFITRNPHQLKKTLRTKKTASGDSIRIIIPDKPKKNSPPDRTLENCLMEICKHTNYGKGVSVFILGRYNRNNPKNLGYLNNKFSNLKISYHTVHSAKGLEADYVILTEVNSGWDSFPSEMADDPVLNLVLSETDDYCNSEERRLFYVALTRTRNKLFILSHKHCPSPFVIELLRDTGNEEFVICPDCGTGIL